MVSKYNSEGYKDPVVYEALIRVEEEERAARAVAAYRPLVYICSPYAGDDGVKEVVEVMEQYSSAEGIDQKIVDVPIEKVLVYDPEHIEIQRKFSDEFLGVLKK